MLSELDVQDVQTQLLQAQILKAVRWKISSRKSVVCLGLLEITVGDFIIIIYFGKSLDPMVKALRPESWLMQLLSRLVRLRISRMNSAMQRQPALVQDGPGW